MIGVRCLLCGAVGDARALLAIEPCTVFNDGGALNGALLKRRQIRLREILFARERRIEVGRVQRLCICEGRYNGASGPWPEGTSQSVGRRRLLRAPRESPREVGAARWDAAADVVPWPNWEGTWAEGEAPMRVGWKRGV